MAEATGQPERAVTVLPGATEDNEVGTQTITKV
jgi:hypothetical protein